MTERILIWDAPTRVFHWLLAVTFAGAFITGDAERWRDLHVLLGYSFAGLIAFRLVWGMVGTRYARFRSFVFRPREVLEYGRSLLTGSPRHYLGHNPLGSIVIFLMLGLGTATALSGWAYYADLGGEWLEEVHEASAFGMLGLVGLHIVGVVVSSLLHRENLAGSMLSGRKTGDARQGIARSHAWLALLMLFAVGAFALWYPGTPSGVAVDQAEAARTHAAHDEDG